MLFWCDSSKADRSIARPQITHDKSKGGRSIARPQTTHNKSKGGRSIARPQTTHDKTKGCRSIARPQTTHDKSKGGRSIARPQTTHDKSDIHSCLQRGSNPISHCSDGYKTVLILQGNNTAIGNNQTRGVRAVYKWVSERTHQAYFPME